MVCTNKMARICYAVLHEQTAFAHPGLARKYSANPSSWRTDQPFTTSRCFETIRAIMAIMVAPQPHDAGNFAGSSPKRGTANCNDWHRVGRFHVSTSYNSQSSLMMPDIRLQALLSAIDDHCDFERDQILLKRKVAIDGHQYLEFLNRQRWQLAVLDTGPAHLVSRLTS